MEGERVGKSLTPQEEVVEETTSFNKIVWQCLPYYLSIGMSYNDFFNADVCLHKAYRQADKMKLKRENTLLWLQGMYVYEAILDSAPTLNALAKNHTPNKYSNKPYAITQEEIEEAEESKAKAQMIKNQEFLNRFATQFNKNKEVKNGVK